MHFLMNKQIRLNLWIMDWIVQATHFLAKLILHVLGPVLQFSSNFVH